MRMWRGGGAGIVMSQVEDRQGPHLTWNSRQQEGWGTSQVEMGATYERAMTITEKLDPVGSTERYEVMQLCVLG